MSFPNKQSKLFFFLTMLPFFGEWVCFAVSEHNGISIGYVIFPVLICHCWADRIIPVTSIYELESKWDYVYFNLLDVYYDNKELVRRSDSSGYLVCHVTFILMELLLFLVPGKASLMLLFHACSVYYWLLGLLHVRNYEILRHDRVYQNVVLTLEQMRNKSLLGVIVEKRAKGRSVITFYPIISLLFWMAGILIAYFVI